MHDRALLILISLSDGEKHGYAMMEDIAAFAGAKLGPGTLYGAITRLEQRGWIRPVGPAGERRQPYAITGAGRAWLESEIEKLQKIGKVAARRLRPA
jgi:DNA-binding PadR family transcriptional regulator